MVAAGKLSCGILAISCDKRKDYKSCIIRGLLLYQQGRSQDIIMKGGFQPALRMRITSAQLTVLHFEHAVGVELGVIMPLRAR